MKKTADFKSYFLIHIRKFSPPDNKLRLLIGYLLIVPAIASAQCNLTITNPPEVCSPNTVDITKPSVTAGSDAGLTLTYWTNFNATTPLTNPSAIASSGIFYIKATKDTGCINIQAVTVTINNAVIPTFSPIGPLCQNTRAAVLPSVSTNGISGTWNPATINTSTVGIMAFTFTPDEGQCAVSLSLEITISLNDVTPPVIMGPLDAIINCQDPITPETLGIATATDNCDSNPLITYHDNIRQGNCPQKYTILRTWACTDESGNASFTLQSITVQDNTPPILQGIPPDVSVECNAIPNLPGITAVDNCSAYTDIQYAEILNINPECSGSIVRLWGSVDACGNVSTAQQIITVIPATGIDNVSDQPSYQIYPNPNNGTFHFDYQSAKIGSIRLSVVDMTGRIVWDQIFPGGSEINKIIELPDDSHGIFCTRLISDSGVWFMKIVVE